LSTLPVASIDRTISAVSGERCYPTPPLWNRCEVLRRNPNFCRTDIEAMALNRDSADPKYLAAGTTKQGQEG